MIKNDNDVKYSTICEQGDLGLFADVLSEADNNTYKKSLEKEENDKKKNNK